MRNHIDPAQRKEAFEIVKIASLLLESSEIEFLDSDDSYDLEIYDKEYKIQRQATEKKNEHWILIESKTRNMRIEFKNNEVTFAMGITKEDVEYWQHKDKELTNTTGEFT